MATISKAQTLHQDSTLNHLTYANIFLSDNVNGWVNLPLKFHVEIRDDKGDPVNGAMFAFTFYSNKGASVNSDAIPITGKDYSNWDGNDPKEQYQYVQAVLATQGLKIDWRP